MLRAAPPAQAPVLGAKGARRSGESGSGLLGWDRKGLTFRIVSMLSLVLLPLALVAAWQSQRATQAATESYRASLLAKTAASTAPERDSILSAFATAATLAETLALQRPAMQECVALMQQIAGANPRFAFVGHTESDQLNRCNDKDALYDFSDNEASRRRFANPRADVTFNPSGAVTKQAVVVVSQPVHLADDSFQGFVSISFPSLPLVLSRPDETEDPEFQILTFNAQGEVLTADVAPEDLARLLPRDRDLKSLAGPGRFVFTEPSVAGPIRDFAVVPLYGDRAYALGSAPAGAVPVNRQLYGGAALYAPILMWLVSLLVAVLVLRRQVIAPTRQLRMRMRSFADGRAILSGETMARAPSELREIGETFDSMAEKILHDEAELEDRVHERELLLREVHHRVKNNLQLMSSIINMQIRQSNGPEAEEALRRVQGRLSSLAKFHRELYQSSSLVGLRADQLLEDLARQLIAVAQETEQRIELHLELEPVAMSPDQVSPLAMLVTEAMTNAIKYAGTRDGTRPFVRLALRVHGAQDAQAATVSVENSVGSTPTDPVAADGSGLGSRLISAFAVQLGAEVEQERENGFFRLSVTFALEPFRLEEGTGAAF